MMPGASGRALDSLFSDVPNAAAKRRTCTCTCMQAPHASPRAGTFLPLHNHADLLPSPDPLLLSSP